MKLTLPLFAAFGLAAQQPRIANARLEPRAAGNLSSTFQSAVGSTDSAAWIAWTVPAVKGHGESCCWNNGNRGCGLEGQVRNASSTGPVMLEGSSTLVVLFRIEHRAVDKMRTVSGDCDLDAGGLPVLLLTGVRPAESVALLESTMKPERYEALNAIALHDDPAADAALERFGNASQPERVREKLGFALAAFRGKRGFDLLKRLHANEQDDHVREKNMFAFSVSKEPQAIDTLIDAAKNDKAPRVRAQALFWMAHKAGDREKAAIQNAVDNDPDTEVKKKAVFALKQLPDDQGVPLLIQQARTNKNPEVRKQAMFWLGQSHDPRALTFFQEVLGR